MLARFQISLPATDFPLEAATGELVVASPFQCRKKTNVNSWAVLLKFPKGGFLSFMPFERQYQMWRTISKKYRFGRLPLEMQVRYGGAKLAKSIRRQKAKGKIAMRKQG